MQQAVGDRGDSEAGNAFRLEGLSVEPADGVIRGPAGTEQVDPKVMAVLVELARDPGHVVSRDELLERVWKTTSISDDVVSRCIYCLRGHLERAAGDPAWRERIHTLPRRGYRLEASVEPLVRTAPRWWADPEARVRAGLAVMAGLFIVLFAQRWLDRGPDAVPVPVPGDGPSVAVLPFAQPEADASNAFLGHGIADGLISVLTRSIPQRVIARSSAFALAREGLDAMQVAERLGVTHVVEGRIRLQDERVLVSAQLVDGASGTTTWANRWERSVSGLPELEGTIALEIAQALGIPLRTEALPAAPPPAEAYLDYLHARFLYHSRGAENLERSIELFQRTVAQAPGFADAWAGLASAAWIHAHEEEVRPGSPSTDPELLGVARAAAERALELQPRHAEALIRMSLIARRLGDADRARVFYLQAREVAPDDPLMLAMDSGIALVYGDVESAIRLSEAALVQDPLAAVWRTTFANYLVRAGHLDRAEVELRRILPLLEDRLRATGLALLAQIALIQNRVEDAAAIAPEIDDPRLRAFVDGLLAWSRGDEGRSRDALRRLQTDTSLAGRLRLAELHAWRGEDGPALEVVEELARQIEETPSRAFWLHANLSVSPYLSELRTHPDWPQRFRPGVGVGVPPRDVRSPD